MTLMIPETMVNDLFQCTAARMNGDIIKLIKGQKTCEIDIQKNRVRTDDGWTEARIAEFDRHGNICLSVNYLADYFDYDYQWDDENNTAMLATPEDEPVSLPVRYDLRDYGRVSEVRDQGSWGTCWAFAALSALESSLLPDEKCEFSPSCTKVMLVRSEPLKLSSPKLYGLLGTLSTKSLRPVAPLKIEPD